MSFAHLSDHDHFLPLLMQKGWVFADKRIPGINIKKMEKPMVSCLENDLQCVGFPHLFVCLPETTRVNLTNLSSMVDTSKDEYPILNRVNDLDVPSATIWGVPWSWVYQKWLVYNGTSHEN